MWNQLNHLKAKQSICLDKIILSVFSTPLLRKQRSGGEVMCPQLQS